MLAFDEKVYTYLCLVLVLQLYILLAKLLESSLEFVSHMAFFVEIVIKRSPFIV